MGYTSIQIMPETKKKLSMLKESKRETYDEILNKLIELVPECDDEGIYTDEFRVGLLKAKLDFKKGKIIAHKALKRHLGLG